MIQEKEAESPRLQVFYRDGKLVFSSRPMETERRKYLQSYLDKINRYKVIGFHKGSQVFSLYQPPLATSPGVRSLEMRLKRRFDFQRIPATATISVTKSCQCHCEHCSASFYNGSPREILNFFELREAILQTVDLGVTNIIFLGGEPLLRPDLFELIDSVPKERSIAILFSNGEFLTKEICVRLKKSGLMGVFVSLDFPKPEEHDRFRRREGLFEKAMIGVQNLKKEGLLVGISSYLSPSRLKQGLFEEIMELARRGGVDEVTFFDAIPTGRWLREEDTLLREKDREHIKRLTRLYCQDEKYPGLSVQSTMTSRCGSAFCFAANTQFYLSAFGDMCPCDFTPLSIGRFPDQSISELWEKMVQTPPYSERAKSCRMQDLRFREEYIKRIDPNRDLPAPLNREM